MRYIPLSREPYVLAIAFASGLVIGFAPLQQLSAQYFGKPGFGNAVAVNLMLPATAIVLASYFPKLRTVIVNGVLVALGFVIARWMYYDWRPWQWNLAFLQQRTNPILIAAAIGCAVLGTITALIVGNFRRVGQQPHLPSCPACGYALAANLQARTPTRCPECGSDLHKFQR